MDARCVLDAGGAIPYSAEQLADLRALIARLPGLAPDDIAARDAAVSEGHCPAHLWPLWPVAQRDAALWRTLCDDRRLERYSVYGLFPAAVSWVYDSRQDNLPVIRYDGRTRGRVAIITAPENGDDDVPAGVVIKPCQSRREAEIAAIAGRLGVGPRQLPTLPGFISEEFVAGPMLTDLTPEQAAPARMYAIGMAIAAGLERLHAAGICYNDAVIADPEGRSHTIVRPDGSIRLIDFGVALLLDDHPRRLIFEDAYNAARTDPSFRLFRRLTNPDADGLRRFVADYGRRLARQTPAQIRQRDWRIVREGTAFISEQYGVPAADALRSGLAAGGAGTHGRNCPD